MGLDDETFSSQQVLDDYDSDCTFIPMDSKSPNGNQKKKTNATEETRLHKHWSRRHDYFSKYDEGILLDRTGWYSVTPEAIARTISDLVPEYCIVFDGFVGLGVNAIQFAQNN